MTRFIKGRLTYANVMSTFAVFIVLGAGAYAAAKIDSGDIKNSTIVSKDIKNKKGVKGNDVKDNSLTGADVKDGTVTGGDIADGSVAGADLTAVEPNHFVGAAGEPAFGNGGQGDCVWANVVIPPATISPTDALNQAGFYKDRGGEVHLDGFVTVANGLGGDGVCGNDTPEDNLIFTLPEAYRPEKLSIYSDLNSSGETVIVNGARDAVLNGVFAVPAGQVLLSTVTPGDSVFFDGVDWRAATGPSPTRTKAPTLQANVPELEALLDN